MYKQGAQGWIKHIDFIILDIIVLQISYLLAYRIRQGNWNLYHFPFYRYMALFLLLWDLITAILFNTMHNVMKRGYGKEITATLKHVLIILAAASIFMFSLRMGDSYSRIVIFLTMAFHLILGYTTRVAWKPIVRRFVHLSRSKQSMLAVLQLETAEELMQQICKTSSMEGLVIAGVVLDRNPDGLKTVAGIPVVCSMEDAPHYICREYIDRVFLDVPAQDEQVVELLDDCHEMAIPVHIHDVWMNKEHVKQYVEKVGGTQVLTRTINSMTPAQVIVKRLVDILGGLVGSLAALIIMAVIGPKIKKASPGPILFKQERIGRNGRRFKMIKLRSMYMDADAQKEKYMAQNRVKDGMMFKMDFDPRIIGNEELPDGTRKTGIGDFIRRTSLDEFPQFFNVLKGDMSLVGTRPPTVNEWEKYEFHHRARLSCKPGVTGMWQVSGRSEITDFNEVVKLDTEYITNWSFKLDAKILLKTLKVVFQHKGAI